MPHASLAERKNVCDDDVMPENVRALIVVLALALPAFYIGRRIAGAALADREFAVWRNAWFGITVAAFLTGSFFIFAAIVPIICLYARAVRAASAALFFVLLFAVPVVGVTVGGFGIVNALFDINNARLLSIVLLLPILFATSRRGRRNVGTYAMPDRLVFGYVLLMIALEFRNSDVTNILRVATLHTLDILIPYFVFSRGVSSVTDFRRNCAGNTCCRARRQPLPRPVGWGHDFGPRIRGDRLQLRHEFRKICGDRSRGAGTLAAYAGRGLAASFLALHWLC